MIETLFGIFMLIILGCLTLWIVVLVLAACAGVIKITFMAIFTPDKLKDSGNGYSNKNDNAFTNDERQLRDQEAMMTKVLAQNERNARSGYYGPNKK